MNRDDVERQEQAKDALEESAEAQRIAAEKIASATARLERLAEIMRRQGPFPVAEQISRDRESNVAVP